MPAAYIYVLRVCVCVCVCVGECVCVHASAHTRAHARVIVDREIDNRSCRDTADDQADDHRKEMKRMRDAVDRTKISLARAYSDLAVYRRYTQSDVVLRLSPGPLAKGGHQPTLRRQKMRASWEGG